MDSLNTKLTSHQVARGAMPDAEAFNRMYLVKNVSSLRATYQIRLLAFRAVEKRMQLVLRVPSTCVFDASLDALIQKCGTSVVREDY